MFDLQHESNSQPQVYMDIESDDTGSSVSTVIERFSKCSKQNFDVPKNAGIDIDVVLEPFERLEQEFAHREALQHFVNETALLVQESKQNDVPAVLPDLDVSHLSEDDVKQEDRLKALDGNTNATHSAEELSVKETERAPDSIGNKKDDEAIDSMRRSCLTESTGNQSRIEKAQEKSHQAVKNRPGILKKQKESQSKTNVCKENLSADVNSLMSKDAAHRETSSSTWSLSPTTSLIPKLDHLKSPQCVPLPRKARSTSNLLTAIESDFKPSLIPRPVNKSVTFASNLVRQINSPTQNEESCGEVVENKPSDDCEDISECNTEHSLPEKEKDSPAEDEVESEEGSTSRADHLEAGTGMYSSPISINHVISRKFSQTHQLVKVRIGNCSLSLALY